jgi:hypothetical protein
LIEHLKLGSSNRNTSNNSIPSTICHDRKINRALFYLSEGAAVSEALWLAVEQFAVGVAHAAD